MNKIKKIIDNIYKIPGVSTLKDIYQEVGDKRLYVEPLSMNQSIEDFILEGGTGYNSLLSGRLGKTICEIKASYDGRFFTYGLPFSTLYATGYPLHRIVEGSRRNTLIKKFDKIDYVTISLRDKEEIKLLWKKSEYKTVTLPPSALNGFYLNSFGAKLLGLKDKGFCIVVPKGYEETTEGWELLDGTIWDNRFFIDKIDSDKKIIKIFTQQSNVNEILEKFSKIIKDIKNSLFFSLFTDKGLLVLLSGNVNDLDALWEEIKDLKLTYRLI